MLLNGALIEAMQLLDELCAELPGLVRLSADGSVASRSAL